jgi:pilus assembly protein Flp/PilA
MEIFQHLYRDTSGVTSVEYALLVTFIALVIVTSATALGNALNQTFTRVSTGLGG